MHPSEEAKSAQRWGPTGSTSTKVEWPPPWRPVTDETEALAFGRSVPAPNAEPGAKILLVRRAELSK